MPSPATLRSGARVLALPVAAAAVIPALGLPPMYREGPRTFHPLTDGDAYYPLALACLLGGLGAALLARRSDPTRRAAFATVGSLSAVLAFGKFIQHDPEAWGRYAAGWYLNVAVLGAAAVISTAALAQLTATRQRRLLGAIAAVVATAAVVGLYVYTRRRDAVGFPQDQLWFEEASWAAIYAGIYSLIGMTVGTLWRRHWFTGTCWLLGPTAVVLAGAWAERRWPYGFLA